MRLKILAITTVAVSLPWSASSTLVFDSSLGGVSGSGLGAVSTVLTIQSPGASSTESGSVSFNGTIDVTSNTGAFAPGGTVTIGDVKTGASQTLTRTLGSLGIGSAGEIGIVLNSAEPSGNSITLTGLKLDLFNPSGTSIFSASLASSITFPTTFTGTGNQGFAFRLDSLEAGQLNSIFAGLTPAQIGALRLGLSASASDATGGQETFNLSRISSATPVAEPGTLLLLGSGLVVAAAWSSTRRPRR